MIMENSVIIIAEVGECYNGSMKAAEELIKISKEAGCDYVKFQTLDYENISSDDPEKEWFYKIALSKEKVVVLKEICEKVGIKVLFTPENIKTAEWLSSSGINNVKIASSSILDLSLAKYINQNFQQVFISTGMTSLDEINQIISLLWNINDIYIMHCISEYPTGPLLEKRGLTALSNKDVRLNMMQILKNIFPNYKIGYSDHTDDILAPIAAVAMGAEVIEKHITLDKKTPINAYYSGREYLGTDHVLSIEPDQLKRMVFEIREVEKMFGPWKWERSEGEEILKEFLRCRFVSE